MPTAEDQSLQLEKSSYELFGCRIVSERASVAEALCLDSQSTTNACTVAASELSILTEVHQLHNTLSLVFTPPIQNDAPTLLSIDGIVLCA